MKEQSLKSASLEMMCSLVVAAWDSLFTDMIKKSYKICGLSCNHGVEDSDKILCFQQNKPDNEKKN